MFASLVMSVHINFEQCNFGWKFDDTFSVGNSTILCANLYWKDFSAENFTLIENVIGPTIARPPFDRPPSTPRFFVTDFGIRHLSILLVFIRLVRLCVLQFAVKLWGFGIFLSTINLLYKYFAKKMNGAPIMVLNTNTKRQRGHQVQLDNIAAGKYDT